MDNKKYVTYYRVSTLRQGRSGLGLDAQKELVNTFLDMGNQVLAEFIEVESGKVANRPKLLEAIEFCKSHNATLLVAKLDRLSRNLHFITTLEKTGVDFVCADMPEANTLTIHIFGAVAQHEREIISKRTKDALAQAKKRGVLLGAANPKIRERLEVARRKKSTSTSISPKKYNVSREGKLRESTLDFVLSVKDIIEPLRNLGASNIKIVEVLNRQNIKTKKGGEWTLTQLHRVLVYLDRLKE